VFAYLRTPCRRQAIQAQAVQSEIDLLQEFALESLELGYRHLALEDRFLNALSYSFANARDTS
jgi:hypothetical protein